MWSDQAAAAGGPGGTEPAWQSPWPSRWQRPDHWVAGLRAQAWWEPDAIGWAAALEQNFPAIKAELLALGRGAAEAQPAGAGGGGRWDQVGSVQKTDFQDKGLVDGGGLWREYVLLGAEVEYSGQQRLNQASCPVTTRLLTQIAPVGHIAAGGLVRPKR